MGHCPDSFVLDAHANTCYVLCILVFEKPLMASKCCILYKFGCTKLLAFNGPFCSLLAHNS